MQPRIGDRSLFPDLEPAFYLNHAAVSPASVPVAAAAQTVTSSYARHGLHAFGQWANQRQALKETLAGLLGARPADFGFVANTTSGVIHLAHSIDWRPRDRILCFDGEFPANIIPWKRVANTFDLRLDLLPLAGFGDGSGRGLARVEAELARGARLVAVSAVQFSTGLAMPMGVIADLCHRHGAELFVDGIQAAGACPMDLTALHIDYLSVGSHKWLMGLDGCGFVYVHPDRLESLVPRTAGWLSQRDGLGFLSLGPGHLDYDRPIRKSADWFEGGAFNTVGLASLGASVALIEHLGVPVIYDHIQRYHDKLEPGLQALGLRSERATDSQARSGILSMQPPSDIDGPQLVEALFQRGVSVSLPDGRVRFAPHWPNNLAEVDHVVSAARDAMLGLRRGKAG
jgi:selenocysteine lyase/cysteine desulfurase